MKPGAVYMALFCFIAPEMGFCQFDGLEKKIHAADTFNTDNSREKMWLKG